MATRKPKRLDPATAHVGDHRDSIVPLLHLRVSPYGVRTWTIHLRSHGKRSRKILGHYPAMDAEKAREAALLHRGAIRGEAPAELPVNSLTFDRAVSRYLEWCDRQAAAGKKPKAITVAGYRRTLEGGEHRRVDHLTGLRRLPLSLVDDVALEAIATKIEQAGGSAHDLMLKVRAFLTWCTRPKGGKILHALPAFPETRAPRPDPRSLVAFPESGPDLSALGAVVRAVDRLAAEYPAWAALFRFASLCPTRPGETGRLQWLDVAGLEGEHPVLIVTEAKRGSYRVPLSKAAADVLRALERRGPYVFGGLLPMPDQPPKRARAMLKAYANEEAGRALDWSPKLLRKAPRSWLAERGVPQEVARRLLGHADPHAGDVSAHYDSAAHLARLRELAEAWAAVVANAVKSPTNCA